MKAIVLAAGIGSRLRPWTLEQPKALLPIASGGQSILSRLLEQLADGGVESAVVVTGHGHAAVLAALESAPLPTQAVYNPDYAGMNNGQSLLVARGAVAGSDFLKFDGDLVLDDALLPRLLAAGAGSHILLDDTRPLCEEDMKAQLARDHSRVTAFGKHLPLDSTGVSIGAEKIAAADAPLIFEALEQMIHVDGRTDGYYEDAYDDALRRGLRMGAVSTQGDFWTEIDTPEELEAARVACQAAQAGVPSP